MEREFGDGRTPALHSLPPGRRGDAELCIEFGISRKTGYKIYDRYRKSGAEALSDRSRRPWRYANQLPPQLEARIVGLKRDKPHWGARKIRELLVRRLASEIKVERGHGLVQMGMDTNIRLTRGNRRALADLLAKFIADCVFDLERGEVKALNR